MTKTYPDSENFSFLFIEEAEAQLNPILRIPFSQAGRGKG